MTNTNVKQHITVKSPLNEASATRFPDMREATPLLSLPQTPLGYASPKILMLPG
jgi:hypothetical protein